MMKIFPALLRGAFLALLVLLTLQTGAAFAQGGSLPGPSTGSGNYGAPPPVAAAPAPNMPVMPAPSAGTDEHYTLGAGDKLRVTVYGETDLSGEFQVDGGGTIQMPLIGQVRAVGLNIRQFQDEVKAKLTQGYLKDPQVAVEVLNYRPFYIIGEVNKPGEYPYVNGMNALNAVALAGGYTYRADVSNVYVRRNGMGTEEKLPAGAVTRIQPGDIIRIDERFF